MVAIGKFLIPYILIIFFSIGYGTKVYQSFLWILLHEFIHYGVSRGLGIRSIKVKLSPLGMMLILDEIEELTLKQDIIITLSGPLFNLLLGTIFLYLSYFYNNQFIITSCIINFTLFFFNMLPAFPLDGARMLRNILSRNIIYKRANIITVKVSFIIGIGLCFSFVFLLLLGRINLSIIFAGILIIVNTIKEKERIVYIIMADVVKKKNRFLKNNYIENKSISVCYKKDLISALSILDKNKYNIFFVLDEEMRPLNLVYESEVIEALKLYGNMTFEEFIRDHKNKVK